MLLSFSPPYRNPRRDRPFKCEQLAWDIFVAVLIVYGCVNIPLRIGFDLDSTIGQVVVDAVIDVVFFADMVLSFRTAYFAGDGDTIVDPSDIAWRYLKGLPSTVQHNTAQRGTGVSLEINCNTCIFSVIHVHESANVCDVSVSSCGRKSNMCARRKRVTGNIPCRTDCMFRDQCSRGVTYENTCGVRLCDGHISFIDEHVLGCGPNVQMSQELLRQDIRFFR